MSKNGFAPIIVLSITEEPANSLSMEVSIKVENIEQGSTFTLSSLPDKLVSAYKDWREYYLSLGEPDRHWTRIISQPTNPIKENINYENEIKILRNELIKELNNWLIIPQKFIDGKKSLLKNTSEVSLILNTKKIKDQDIKKSIQKLPWNEWSPIKEIAINSGVSFSDRIDERETLALSSKRPLKLKGLVICGEYKHPDKGIDTAKDLESIKQNLRNKIDITTWITNSDDELRNQAALIRHLEDETYQLLFFSGHSDSTNKILLNDEDIINVDDDYFITSLRKLKERGLIFAFFNSCDGLGIAHTLSSAGIPYVGVMKETVHDTIAQTFIQEFLRYAAKEDMPIHIAFNSARKFLKSKQNLFDGDFLPAFFNNQQHPPFYINSSKFRKRLFASGLFMTALSITGYFAHVILNNNLLPGRYSMGEEHLIGSIQNTTINEAHQYFLSGKFEDSFLKFNTFLKENKNKTSNPDIVIFRNNAKAYDDYHLSKQRGIDIKLFKIATSVPLGNMPEIAKEILRGVAQYQTEYNKTNDSKKIIVVIGNDDNDKGISKKIANKVVEGSDTIAFVGNNSSEASEATAPIFRHRMVMISPTSFSVKLKKDDPSDSIYRMVPQITIFAAQLANYIKENRRDANVGICIDLGGPDNNRFQQEFIDILSTISKVPLDLKCGNFKEMDSRKQKEIIRSMRQEKINLLLIAPSVKMLGRTISFMKEIKKDRELNKIEFIANSTLHTKETSDQNTDKLLDGLVIPTPYFLTATNKGFFTSFYNEWHVPLDNWRTPMSYAGMKIIASNFSTDSRTDRETILNKMNTTESYYLNPVFKQFSFDNVSGEGRSNNGGESQLIKLIGKEFKSWHK